MKLIYFTEKDFSQVMAIYQQGINTGLATFEKEVTTWESWNKSHIQACRLAIVDDSMMAGWAALTAVSGRCVYAGVAELSIYIAQQYRNLGVGTKLLNELITQSEEAGFWTLQSGIFADNTASIELHKKCGFRVVGFREKIGQLNGIWKDTILMERRSKTVGI